ncbi:WhiB family transcriptional regulator [Microbacterium aurantiacum]
MEAICWRCPVRELCAAFADVAQPAGFWAGQRR